jgi:ribonuclease HII
MCEIVGGIDEAGRGSVLGPLIIGYCSLTKEQEKYFKDLGVKDSKLLSKSKRKEFFKKIIDNCVQYSIIAIPAEEINILMNRYSLNEIEAMKTVEIILKFKKKPKKLILDCPDTNAEKYKERVLNILKKQNIINDIEIISEHKADYNYISVSCASVLAKVTRDQLMNDLVGQELSGYSSDLKTIEYIKTYILENKKIPPFARDKWSTIENIISSLYQKKIGWFDEKHK